MKSGSWQKERTSGRKYSGGDQDRPPKPHARKRIWVSAYRRRGKRIEGYFRTAS